MKKLIALLTIAISLTGSASTLNLSEIGLSDQTMAVKFSAFEYSTPILDDPFAPTQMTIKLKAVLEAPVYDGFTPSVDQEGNLTQGNVSVSTRQDLRISVVLLISEIESATGKSWETLTSAERQTVTRLLVIQKTAQALGIVIP